MNITLEKQDAVNGTLIVEIVPEDYTENYAKSLKDFAKKASLPGFRPGRVPQGLVKQRFGQELLAEAVEKLLREKMFAYIRDNKINMLGEPLNTEANKDVEIAEGKSFTFKFDLALAPEMNVELSKDDKLPYYEVQVSDEQVKGQVEMYRQRGGSYDKVDSYEDNDMLKGTITELDKDGNAVAEGVTAEGVVMLPKYFKNEDQKALFAGAKTGDVVRFNPAAAYDNSEAELASLLKVEKEKAKDYTGDFNFQITEITRFVPGPLDQKLFDEVFPEGEVKSEEEFTAKIKSQIEEQFKKDSDYKFQLDLRQHVTEKVGKLQFPDEKLKRIMLQNVDGDEKKVEDNYEKSLEELTWHLMKEQIADKFGIKVEDKDVREMAAEVTRMQFAQYGMLNIPQQYIDDSVKRMLEKRETVDNLIDRCVEMKIAAAVKEAVTLETKQVSAEDFNKMFEK